MSAGEISFHEQQDLIKEKREGGPWLKGKQKKSTGCWKAPKARVCGVERAKRGSAPANCEGERTGSVCQMVDKCE